MLIDQPDSLGNCICRATQDGFLAAQENLPFIGAIKSDQNAHEGAFARAVFAQQGMNFAGLDFKIYVVIGNYTGKTLGNAYQFYGGYISLAVIGYF